MLYETNLKALTEAETTLKTALDQYKSDHASSAKRLEQAHEDKKTTEAERKSVREYMASIKPGCDYIQAHKDDRDSARADEKTALLGAIDTLKASPAYTNYAAKVESDDLGKCSEICDGQKDTNTAECQACQHGVSVYGFCTEQDPDTGASLNANVPGCEDPTATGSADEMNAEEVSK